jgi:hypothetical protein
MFYHFSHTPSPFFCSHFLNRVSCFCPGWPGPQPSYLHLSLSWDDRCVTPHLPFIDSDGVFLTFFFLFGLASNSPDLCLSSSWDYRWEPLCLSLFLPFMETSHCFPEAAPFYILIKFLYTNYLHPLQHLLFFFNCSYSNAFKAVSHCDFDQRRCKVAGWKL